MEKLEQGWQELTDRVRWIKKCSIEGVLKEKKQFTYEGHPSFNYLLETSEGLRWVNGHKRINNYINERVEIGDTIKIDFLGTKNGKPVFRIFLKALAKNTERKLG